jgi:hypothetical protein
MCGVPESCLSASLAGSGEKVVGECKLVIGKLHNVIAGTRGMRTEGGHEERQCWGKCSAREAQDSEGRERR